MVTQDRSSCLVAAPPEILTYVLSMAPVSTLCVSPWIVICLGDWTQNQGSLYISAGR